MTEQTGQTEKLTLNAVLNPGKDQAHWRAGLPSFLSSPLFTWSGNLYGDESLPRLADRFRFGLSTK